MLSKEHKDDIFWYATGLASRNVNVSPFFFDLSLCLLIKRKVDSSRISKVIVERGEVAEVIKKYVRSRNIKCEVISKKIYNKTHINIVEFINGTLNYIKEKKTYTQMKSQMPTGSINIIHCMCSHAHVSYDKCIDRTYTDIQKISSNKNIYFVPWFMNFSDHPALYLKNTNEDTILSVMPHPESCIIRKRILSPNSRGNRR